MEQSKPWGEVSDYPFEKKLREAKGCLELQGSDGNWNYDPYMHGMYNGMEFMLAMFEDREPQYRSAPKKWLFDKEEKARKDCVESFSKGE